MGTNFYARRIPTQEEIAALHKHIDEIAAGVYSISSMIGEIEIVDDIQEWIGDGLKVFAETEDNLFWVRNEKYGVDIEVARSGITYEKAQRWAEEDIRRVK